MVVFGSSLPLSTKITTTKKNVVKVKPPLTKFLDPRMQRFRTVSPEIK